MTAAGLSDAVPADQPLNSFAQGDGRLPFELPYGQVVVQEGAFRIADPAGLEGDDGFFPGILFDQADHLLNRGAGG